MNKRIFFIMLVTASLAAAEPATTSFLLIRRKRTSDEDQVPRTKIFIQKKMENGKFDPRFREIECRANPGELIREKCYPLETAGEKKFFVVDCFNSKSTGVICQIRRFQANGEPDRSFNYSLSGAGSYTSLTTDVQTVIYFSSGTLMINGEFLNPTFMSGPTRRIRGTLELNQQGEYLNFSPAMK